MANKGDYLAHIHDLFARRSRLYRSGGAFEGTVLGRQDVGHPVQELDCERDTLWVTPREDHTMYGGKLRDELPSQVSHLDRLLLPP